MAEVLDDTATEDAVLVLHELAAELPQECDYPSPCTQEVEWEITCRWCHGYAYLCDNHARAVAARQRWCDANKGGQRCRECGESGREALIFSPMRSRDEAKLW